MAFFEFVLSGFWTFCGVVILLGTIGKLAVYLIVGSLGALRGNSVQLGSSSDDEIVGAVKAALERGDLDASVERAELRNNRRARYR